MNKIAGKPYSGVGSRKTPDEIGQWMTYVASKLQDNYTLRSGSADGADLFFENGCTNGNKEIYIPWKGFNKSDSLLVNQSVEAMYIASQYHPNWKKLKDSVKKLHSRNVHQVLGYDCKTPSIVLLCWTPDGCEHHRTRSRATGGTGQAISIASMNDVEVINMKHLLWKDRLEEIIGFEL